MCIRDSHYANRLILLVYAFTIAVDVALFIFARPLAGIFNPVSYTHLLRPQRRLARLPVSVYAHVSATGNGQRDLRSESSSSVSSRHMPRGRSPSFSGPKRMSRSSTT